MTKEYILEYLRGHKKEFKEKFGISKIALFGSYARDEQREGSDIDILVTMPPKFRLYYDFKYLLEKELNHKIDLGLEKNMRGLIRQKIQEDIIYV
jgi:predicted nucleotidyltransferase